MKKTLLIIPIMLLTVMQMQAQKTKQVQKILRGDGPGDLSIPFTKYKLANGLTLIVHEDHSDPIVHVDVTYHVGSGREEIGMSGFAHFFEHMMFQGSKNVGDEEHFKIVTQAGGTMNGTTNRDRTNYFETVPKNYLETALWLEADRMGFLLDAVTQKKFEIQRATVKNEKGQRYENRPYGMVGEVSSKNFYPFGHTYSWPTIGYVEDLNRVGVEDLKKFFLRWYGPNNAVVTVGGDVSTSEVLDLVEKYFGSIPKGPDVPPVKKDKFTLDKDRYVSMEDNVRFPMLKMTWPSVPNYDKDEAPLDILAEILGQGKSSLLYQNFVKSQKALQAYAANPCFEQAGEFSLNVLAYPDTKLADVEKMLRQTLEEFEKRGVKDDDLIKAKIKREAETIYSLESVSGKVSQLASYETFLGTPSYINDDIERYRKVTREDIMRVYNTYIKGKHALILSVYPKGKKELIAAEDNFTPGGDSSKAVHANLDTLKMRPVTDNFDRSKRPQPGESPVVNAPAHYTMKMPTGILVTGIENKEVPDAYLQLNVAAGQWKQPKGKEGIAYLLSKMLQESTEHMTAEAIDDELDRAGSHVSIYADNEDIVVGVTGLTRNMGRTLAIVSEMIGSPKFDADEFDRVKKQQLELIANQSVQPEAIASTTFNSLIYGEGHPLSTSIYGTAASVKSITLDDVKAYYAKYFKPAYAKLIISGDMDQRELRENLMPLEMWGTHRDPHKRPQPVSENAAAATEEIKLPAAPAIEKTKIYLVNKEGAPQSELRVGYLALPYDATGEYYKASVMNYILGGAFNSRINLNLREDKGYTYGARSYFSGSHIPGPFVVATGVRGDVTDSAVAEILKEIKLYRDKGITADELDFTKKSILEREALKYETNSQKANYVERIAEYNAPDDYVLEQARILKKLKKRDINKLAKKHLPIDNMVIVVVGDAKSAKPGLEKLGYEVVVMNPFEQSMKN